MAVVDILRSRPMKHRWVGSPKKAMQWHAEKRGNAQDYFAIGGTTIAGTLILVRLLWDGLDPTIRWWSVIVALGFGGTIFAFGPLLYYISDKYTIWLVFPMREEWRKDLTSTWSALTGYLSSRGVQWRRLRSWSSQGIVLGLDEGLRVMMLVSDAENDRKRRTEVMVSIHRINEGNVEWAEKVQRILDEWPLLEELKGGVDGETAEDYMDM